MRIVVLEGLKGTGKSTIIKRIVEGKAIRKPEKISKGVEKWPEFVTEIGNRYSARFRDVGSSLGLQYYANFFTRVGRVGEDETVIFDRGLLSLPYFGFYGYLASAETVLFGDYERTATTLFERALEEYGRFSKSSSFFILDCSRETIKRRLASRRELIPSEQVFLDNFGAYVELKRKTEDLARQRLGRRCFFEMSNEKPEDLEKIVLKIEECLESKT